MELEEAQKIVEENNAVVYHNEEYDIWGVSLKPGFVSFATLSGEKDKDRATVASGIFILLWKKGITYS